MIQCRIEAKLQFINGLSNFIAGEEGTNLSYENCFVQVCDTDIK